MAAANKPSGLVNNLVTSKYVENVGSVALVMGGAHKIGHSIAEHLLAAGLKVALTDVRWSSTRGAAVQLELESTYLGSVMFIVSDGTCEVMFLRAIETVVEKFGRIDVIINAAGVSYRDFDIDMESSIMTDMESTNISSVFRGTTLGMKYMSRENGGRGGTVVNLSSVSCFTDRQRPFLSLSGTKPFVDNLTRCYGNPLHFDSSEVRVLSINPGTSGGGTILDVQHLGHQLMSVLRKARTGTAWSIINNQPAREIKAILQPIRTELYRSKESSSSFEDLVDD